MIPLTPCCKAGADTTGLQYHIQSDITLYITSLFPTTICLTFWNSILPLIYTATRGIYVYTRIIRRVRSNRIV